jgi:hypothetical protein
MLLDRLCGLAVRVHGYRSRGPGSIPGTTKTKVVGLERGPLGLVSTTEELLGRKSKVRVLRGADNLTAICEPVVWTMWDPQHMTTVEACCGDSFYVVPHLNLRATARQEGLRCGERNRNGTHGVHFNSLQQPALRNSTARGSAEAGASPNSRSSGRAVESRATLLRLTGFQDLSIVRKPKY